MATKWTVMVYLGADNNLSADFLWNLKEMQEVDKVGPYKDVTVVAQYDPGQGIPTQRYVINRESLEARETFFPINKNGQKGAENVRPSSSRDGWLILDEVSAEDKARKAEAEERLTTLLGELRNIVTVSDQLKQQLLRDSELKKKFKLKDNGQLTAQQERSIKEYFRGPGGLKKLREDTGLRNFFVTEYFRKPEGLKKLREDTGLANPVVKALVGDQLKEIARDCETEEGKLMNELRSDSELVRKFGLKEGERLTEQQESLLKEYFRTPEGLSKLRNSTLRDLVFGFELSRAKEERFREYQTTLEGSKDPKNKNTGNPMTLLEFILWGINNFEATHYMVVLAGHGSGAVEDFLLKDDNARDSLTLHELRDVFQLVQQKLGGRKLAILGMDSCLMSMAEVYYQLVGSVEYLVGAEGFEPSGGWPYQRILDSLIRLGDEATPDKVARDIVDKYVLYYFDYALAGLSVDLSACKIVEDEKKLAKAIGELGLSLKAKLETRPGLELVISARHQAQCYKFDQYVDLVDFCDKLKDELKKLKEADPSYIDDPLNDFLNDLCGRVKEEVTKVVENSSYVGPDFQESNGLSVYFPWNCVPKSFSEGYEQLEFTRRTNLTPNQIKVLKLRLKLPLEVTQPTDFTLHTNSEWYRFIETFTEKMRALIPTEGAEGKTLFSAATLHSPKTLFGGSYGQFGGSYGQFGGSYGQFGGSYGQGAGGSLGMAYCKPLSLVWKPHTPTKLGEKDVIDTQIRRVRGTRIIARHPAVVPSSANEEDKKALVEALGGKAEELKQTLTQVQALGKVQQTTKESLIQDSREIEQLLAEKAGVKETIEGTPAMEQLVIQAMKPLLTKKAGVAPARDESDKPSRHDKS